MDWVTASVRMNHLYIQEKHRKFSLHSIPQDHKKKIHSNLND